MVPLIGCIREKGFSVLCTSGTVTSANIAAARLPAGTIHQFVTLDAPRFVNRFFDHWRPDLGLFVEFGSVAQSDHDVRTTGNPVDPAQRPAVRALVRALAMGSAYHSVAASLL